MTDSPAIAFAKSKPPSGTHEISIDDLKYKPDLRLAGLCTEFCAHTYRILTSAATPDSYKKEVARLRDVAQIYGYHAEAFSTPQQQAVIFYNDQNIIVSFEGSRLDQVSHYNRNLLTYLRFKFAEGPTSIGGRIHYGFNSALDEKLVNDPSTTLWDGLKQRIEQLHDANSERKLFYTGHSAGGAIATIATARSLDEKPYLYVDGLYTYGQPRAGDREFKNGLEKALNEQRERLHHPEDQQKPQGTRYFRFEQYGDPMPALPPKGRKHIAGEYVHGGQWIPMDLEGRMLAMNDSKPKAIGDTGNPVEDTFSRSNPADYIGLTSAYKFVLTGVISAIRQARQGVAYVSGYQKTDAAVAAENADIKVIENEALADTFSGILNLFSVKNYLHHEMPAYRKGVLMYREAHPREATVNELKEGDAQHLLWRTINLSEHLETAIALLPEGETKQAAQQCYGVVDDILKGWEPLRTSSPRLLLRPQTTHVGPYYNFWVTQPTTISELRATFVNEVQDGERHNQVIRLRDALTQFTQTADLEGQKHEELKSLMPDVQGCLNAAMDVVNLSAQQRVTTR